jgi:hypothetical protein
MSFYDKQCGKANKLGNEGMTEIFAIFCLFTRTKFCENPLSGSPVFFFV